MSFKQRILNRLCRLAPKNQLWTTPIAGLYIHHSDNQPHVSGYIQKPSICVVLQGERVIRRGKEDYRFSAGHMMFCPVNLPLISQVNKPPAQQPYLAMSLQLDLTLLAQVATEIRTQKPCACPPSQLKWALNRRLFDSLLRLLDLLDCPHDIPFLAPLILREIYYRLLQSEQGDYLRSLLSQESHIAKIARATHWLQTHFAAPLAIAELARQVGMSQSNFYQHFKHVTSMSPLQYQKSLRLSEARRLLQLNQHSITQIAYEVGYASPNQFSREYKRYFGVSPRGDK